MPRQPWRTGRLGFDYLPVPSLSQPPKEPDCVVYALWMVANYVGNEFPDRTVRERTNVPTIDRIKEYIETDELGWTPNQADLTDLSTSISSVDFSLESWHGEPPRNLLSIAEERLAASLPLIAFIDAQQFHQGIRGSGPLHAIVIAGLDPAEDRVAILNPWYTTVLAAPKERLEDAWDPTLHQIIDVRLNRTTDSTGRDDQ